MEIEHHLIVGNKVGMHLRAASKIVSLLRDFDCEVEIHFNGRIANAKSIMSITQLVAPLGSELLLKASGPDARRAALALDKLFRDKFGEE